MRNIQILSVGKLKEAYLTAGCKEYQKRFAAFGKLQIVELEEVRLSDKPAAAEIERALALEGEKLLEKSKGTTIIALCVEGDLLSSEQLAAKLDTLEVQGSSAFSLVIGSSFGLHPKVKAAAALRLSFSRMTFPHQLMRLMLCEQLYRAAAISAGTKYHK